MFDKYTLKARIAPAVINCLPLIILLTVLVKQLNLDLKSIIGFTVLSTVAIPYFLSEIIRNGGKKLEVINYQKWGGIPTTILLRQSDTEYDVITINRIYDFISSDFEIDLRTDNSDGNITNAVKHIISMFHRQKDDLLLTHNIDYGFARNLAGGSTLLFIQLAVGTLIAIVNAYFHRSTDNGYWTIGVLVALGIAVVLRSKVYPYMVRDRAFRYATTLIDLYYYHKTNQVRPSTTVSNTNSMQN